MKITININTGNSAFWNESEDSENLIFDYQEIDRILKEILPKFEYRDFGKCVDINGNSVGDYNVERDY